LFQSRLTHRVLLNAAHFFKWLKQAKYTPDASVEASNLYTDVVTIFFDKLNVRESLAQLTYALIQVNLAVNFARIVQIIEFLSKRVENLLLHCLVKVSDLKIRLLCELIYEHCVYLRQLFFLQSFYLDFHHITCTKLVLYVLRASKTLENATFHHDSHFGAKRFCFLHTMCCKNDCTCFPLGNFRDD